MDLSVNEGVLIWDEVKVHDTCMCICTNVIAVFCIIIIYRCNLGLFGIVATHPSLDMPCHC